MSRPSKYTESIADDICDKLEAGVPLLTICLGDEMPSASTVYRWLASNEEFRDKYARARENQAHTLAERAVNEAIEAKDASIGRLRYDALKWFAGKLLPKAYGDKVQHTGADGASPVGFVIYGERESPDADTWQQAHAPSPK